jgi:alpha-L-arabinofuranosidase
MIMKKIWIVAATLTVFCATGALLRSRVFAGSVPAGSLVKGSASAVYYITKDGKRHAFPNERVYFSWYQNYASVQTISDASMASFPLGSNVTYRPGTRLIKVQSDPKVYAVDAPNVLRWVTTEQVASAVYGSAWNTKVDDLSDAFFFNYTVGAPLTDTTSYVPANVTAAWPTIQSLVDGAVGVPNGNTNTNTPVNTNAPTNTNTNSNTNTNTSVSNTNVNAPTVAVPSSALTVAVDRTVVKNSAVKKLLGISFDGRTSIVAGGAGAVPAGYIDPKTDTWYPAIKPLWVRVPVTTVRYPGNLVNLGWNWKSSIGPVATRKVEVFGPGAPAQSMHFGFDEFMNEMTVVRGLPASDMQIMVNIYPTAAEPNAADAAADFVEYANAPNNGSNPRGGTDWAAVRAANGHAAPYGIKIWNIGNEPWTPKELNFDPVKYIPIALPLIDEMRKVDPTIRITLPAVGDATTKWNQGILNSSSLSGKFDGLSPHFFYDADNATQSPSVEKAKAALLSLTAAAKAKGLVVFIGDNASAIQTNAGGTPTSDPDRAMQWEGALVTADFLAMATQIDNVERGNFWIYGYPQATWAPIRLNADGTYTFTAAAQVYEWFYSFFLDQSHSAKVATVSGATVSAVRAAAFSSLDQKKLHVLLVNTGLQADEKAVAPSIPGYTLTKATTATATSMTSDTMQKTTVFAASDTTYPVPHAGLLLFEFTKSS